MIRLGLDPILCPYRILNCHVRTLSPLCTMCLDRDQRLLYHIETATVASLDSRSSVVYWCQQRHVVTLILEPETILNRPVLTSSDCIELLDVLFIVVELCSSSRIM